MWWLKSSLMFKWTSGWELPSPKPAPRAAGSHPGTAPRAGALLGGCSCPWLRSTSVMGMGRQLATTANASAPFGSFLMDLWAAAQAVYCTINRGNSGNKEVRFIVSPRLASSFDPAAVTTASPACPIASSPSYLQFPLYLISASTWYPQALSHPLLPDWKRQYLAVARSGLRVCCQPALSGWGRYVELGAVAFNSAGNGFSEIL